MKMSGVGVMKEKEEILEKFVTENHELEKLEKLLQEFIYLRFLGL